MTNKNSGDVPGRVKTVTTGAGTKITQALPGYKTKAKRPLSASDKKK